MHMLFDVIRRITILETGLSSRRPLFIERRNLRRGVETFLLVCAHGLSQQLLAVPLAISVRGVEKGAAMIHCGLQRLQRLLVRRARPASHAPHPIADLADLPACSSELSISHGGHSKSEMTKS